MAKYYYTNMISALATGQISYRDAMCEILKRLCDLENDKVQNQADWTETDSTSPSYIQHKPSVQEFQADWNETNSTAYGYIQNKPEISEQVQPDWDETDPSSLAFILNKPPVRSAGLNEASLIPPSTTIDRSAYFAASGVFQTVQSKELIWNNIVPSQKDNFQQLLNDFWNQPDWQETDQDSPSYIRNKPSLPSAQVQSDWAETDTSSVSFIKNKPGTTTSGATSGTLVPPTQDTIHHYILHADGSWGPMASYYVYWGTSINPQQITNFKNVLLQYGTYPRVSWSRYTQCFAYQRTLPAGATNVWGLQCVQEWIPDKFWHFHGWVCLYTADNSGVTTPFFNYGINMESVIEHTDLTVSDLYQAYTSGRMYSQSKKYVRYTDSAIDPSDAFAALQFTEQQIGGVIELTYDADAAYPCLGRHCAYVYSGSTMELQDYPLAQQKPGFIEFEIWVNAES